MTERRQLDVEQRWPELFDGLDEQQRWNVVQSLAAAWHEGWEPNREDVENLTNYVAGRIDHPEYARRAREAVQQMRGSGQ